MRSKMKKEINPKIIKETTKCCFEFQCIEEDGKPQCEVEALSAGGVLFVKNPLSLNCNYHLSNGYGHICHCPTRIELYRKYNI